MKTYILFLTFLFLVTCKNTSKVYVFKGEETMPKKHFIHYPKANLSSGKLMRMDSLTSNFIRPRPVDVWLPENYSESNKYAVLYMHDGQMLFDSTATWNKQEWKVDEWASKLMHAKKTKEFIVVAIHSIKEERWLDLFPQKAFYLLNKENKALIKSQTKRISNDKSLNGDNYLNFLIDELKPIVDTEFSTHKNKENTFIMGSSMGGLMSMYAFCEYPKVFSGAACISTHWPGAKPIENNPLPKAIFKYMATHLPETKLHRIYFDYGTETLDAYYPKYAPVVDSILKLKGYTTTNSINRKFEGTNHSENSWNKRLDIPLVFLIKN